jgi:multiple sugar transport system substrate-binding protein
MDADEVPPAVSAGILQPLDDLIDQKILDDLYPFARAIGSHPDGQMAVQFAADLEHMAYNSRRVASAPVTWTDVLSSTARTIFPAAGRQGQVNRAFLIQYQALGGRYLDESSVPILDVELLERVLAYYVEGNQSKAFPNRITELENPGQCWELFLEGGAGITTVEASRYLRERESNPNAEFAPIPTWKGNVTTMAWGYALAIVAQDSLHQEAAARVLDWLMEPGAQAELTLAAGLLPTRREAVTMLGSEDAYFPFLHWQLEAAQSRPGNPAFAAITEALQKAVQDVLAGSASPEDAAQSVLETVGQPTG